VVLDDEFSMLVDNAEEAGLPWSGPPAVERVATGVATGKQGGRQQVSALRWGTSDPELVLLHGGAQNAHTWDTVALALDRPLLAIDLPGHGRSDWRDDHDYSPVTNAQAVAVVMERLAPHAALLVGMSLGGLTAIRVAARRPDLVRRLAIVDVTPGVDHEKAEPIIAFVSGPESFASFDEILERTITYNPPRTESSLRRGVLHNAREREDGSWVWRYDRQLSPGELETAFAPLWDDLASVTAPLLLVRGRLSGVVSDADVEELRRRRPDARVEGVEGAGHSVQGDRPVELARLLDQFLSAV